MRNALSGLPVPVLLDIAIVATALSWGLGLFLTTRRVFFFESLAMGAVVCLVGYSAASLGAPLWLVIAAPIPLDFLLLWYLIRKPRPMAVAYVVIWAIYLAFHIVLSGLLRYDSLIPPWRLHS